MATPCTACPGAGPVLLHQLAGDAALAGIDVLGADLAVPDGEPGIEAGGLSPVGVGVVDDGAPAEVVAL